MSQSIRDLEAQRRVTSGLEVFSISEAAEISARALAAEEKCKREAQMQASNINKLQAETQKLRREEEEEKLREQQQKEQDKKKEEQREQEKKREAQEQREKKEKAIESANAERIRVDQLQKEQKEKKRAMEEKEEKEQRQLAASISSERERCEAERLQRIDAFATQPVPNPDQAIDIVDVEKEKKAEVLRLKREAFLKDMNAFSYAIEQEAGKSALGTNGTISDQYSSSAGSSRTGATYENLPLPIPLDFTPHEMMKMGVSNSFNDLTSSLFAANSASDAVGNGTDIWGESSEVPHINRAANVTVNPSGSGRQKRELAVSEYSDRRNGRGGITEFEEDEEEDEGMGGAASISNILTKDERMVLSTQQKVAWKALQADLTTRRKGNYYMCYDDVCSP